MSPNSKGTGTQRPVDHDLVIGAQPPKGLTSFCGRGSLILAKWQLM
jgi:hypothetical protein